MASQTVRLRLFYGSVNVRVMNRELLDGFELATPHGSVRMTQPGRIRVDAERAPQTTSLEVFEGVAVLAVPGSTLTVRQGRSAQSQDGDVLTGAAGRDGCARGAAVAAAVAVWKDGAAALGGGWGALTGSRDATCWPVQ